MTFDLPRIFQEMQIQGMNEVILSARSGVSVPWINKIRKNEGVPSAVVVKKLADALKLNMRDLYLGNGKRNLPKNGKRRTKG